MIVLTEKKQFFDSLGLRIAETRIGKKMTQAVLAERLDTTIQFISDLERGIVGISLLKFVKLCTILDVSSDYLLFGNRTDNYAVMAEKLSGLTTEDLDLFDHLFATLDKKKKG